jgi:hypothetical protein
MDAAVLVVSETFMSRVEKLDASCEKGENKLLVWADCCFADGGEDDCKGDGER